MPLRSWPLFFTLCILPFCAVGETFAQSDVHDRSWRKYDDAHGTSFDFPSGLFVKRGDSTEATERWTTADGRAVLSTFTVRNPESATPASFLKTRMKEQASALDYLRVARGFFAASRYRGDKILYQRCNFSTGRGTIHCIDLEYPAREKRAWDATVTRISRSLRPLNS
jgi:hypothetical protein